MKPMEHDVVFAGLRICVISDTDLREQQGPLDAYFGQSGPRVHTYRVETVEKLEESRGSLIWSEPGRRIYRFAGGEQRFIGSALPGSAMGYICVERIGNESQIQLLRESLLFGIEQRIVLKALDLPHILTIHDGFLLHASFIEHEGRAILFTAPSETGKSTQAQLWCDHMGAELVNGDRAAVRIIDGQVFACGIPFSGSSTVRRNVILPLSAIVYLSQAPENSISRLRGVRAFRSVWEGCTVNTWDREDVEKATKTVTEVITRVPVYHLACTPDARAVELLQHTMEVEK